MRHNFSKVFFRGFLLALGLFLFMSSAHAANRSQSWEASFLLKNLGSESITGPSGATLDFDDDTGWGFTIGYNLNEHLNLAYEFSSNEPTYTARFTGPGNVPRTFTKKANFYSNNFNATFHLTKGRFAPYVSGGFGWTFIDSNVSNGEGYCAPGYYWGWYCYQESYNSTDFSYNAAVGLRLDFEGPMFVRGSYGMQWTEFSQSSSDPEFEVIRVEFGTTF